MPTELGDVPKLAPWVADMLEFEQQKNGDVLMGAATGRYVFCRLLVADVLPKFFGEVLRINVEYAQNAAKIDLDEQRKAYEFTLYEQKRTSFRSWQVIGVAILTFAGAFAMGYMTGGFAHAL